MTARLGRELRMHWASMSGLGRLGLALLAALATVAVAAPWLAPHDPNAQVGPAFAPPSGAHWLGTNDIGQDILSELIFGARISLTVGVAAALAATLVGTLIGLTAGYLGGWVDAALMRVVDVALSLPFLPLMIVIGVFLGPGLTTLVVVITAVAWAPAARELRAQVLSSRRRESIQAIEALGAGPAHVLSRHLVPALVPLIVPQFIRAATIAILAEASLSFLGLGDPTAKSWGTILFFANARSAFLTDGWLWWIVPPGVAIALSVLSFAFVGFALEERARPRLHALMRAERPDLQRPASSRRPVASRRPMREGSRPAAPGSLLAARNLTVDYGDTHAVDRVGVEVHRGEVLGIVGGSGSGKSTVLAAVIGLLKAPAAVRDGTILYDGRDLLRAPERDLRALRGEDLALVPQSAMNALDPVQTVRTQIAEAVRLHHRISRQAAGRRAEELLELVGIRRARAGAYPHELSGGMRQRAVIAMALANEPRLLLVDEPTTGLDSQTRDHFVALLVDLRSRLDLTIVFVSHDLDVVRRIADRIAVMRAGRIVEQGPTAEIVGAPRHPYTRRLLSASRPPRHHPARAVPAGRPLLRLEGVTKRYRDTVAADVVDLAVHDGEVVGLVGPSGAGKSTLGRLALQLERADHGRVEFLGQDLTRLPSRRLRAVRRDLQLVFQDPYQSLPEHRRVGAIVAEPLVVHREPDAPARVPEALDAVGLAPATYASRYPSQLSGGERQRVALARAVVLRPRLVVLDEPTSMLDAELRGELLACLEHLREHLGVAYLCITHDLVLARAFCDRFVELREGTVVRTGAIADHAAPTSDADAVERQGGASHASAQDAGPAGHEVDLAARASSTAGDATPRPSAR